MTKKFPIPDSFCVSPFYEKNAVISFINFEDELSHKSLWDEGYFLYDILNEHGQINEYIRAPWENKKELVNQVITLWNEEGLPLLTKCFQERNRKKARPIMIKFIAIYIQTMFWLNGSVVPSLQNISLELEKFSYTPWNMKERIEFVLNAPDHHHSFATLTQLYDESRKKWSLYLRK